MQMRCFRKILHILYKDNVTNEEVRAKIQQATAQHEDLLTIVKGTQIAVVWSCLASSGLAKTILQGTVRGREDKSEEEEGKQHQEMDRPGVRQFAESSGKQGKMEDTGGEIICGAPTTLSVKG